MAVIKVTWNPLDMRRRHAGHESIPWRRDALDRGCIRLVGGRNRWLLGQIDQKTRRSVQRPDGEIEKRGTLAAHAQRPPILLQPGLVEFGFFSGGRGGAQEAAESADQSKVDLGGEVPEGLQLLRLQSVDEFHRGYQASLGRGATDVMEIGIGAAGAE